ncbi:MULTISPECIES: T9SS type A sorting domain-containing protein [unclassified Dysgonomonas]|jgi:hypothetical protein|uniref:T9SS type A sorting domain-containing protein n=1 Tax=unclassified Dysgonomonas TaxID=2630389 RepID=UPI0025C015BC|nr:MULTISPECIES: T9SS type A sorting domain-containing protein [unclassified Dysgonomonas]MDR2002365.1 T9SS type A sorting domain-containing protein [Prevotella sp.]HMM04997.1 T9SS C-terminal target domain-containing protein [Dysgonomonas sp.]
MKPAQILILLFLWMALPGFSQLNSSHNHLRPGDVLIKQQVEYKDPGGAGKDQLWDFRDIKTLNDAYTLTYSLPPLEGDSVYILGATRYPKKDISDDELIVGTEHNTMYYYRMIHDSLLQTGHENPVVELKYTNPMVLMQYPLNYGQSITSDYTSKGLYSGTVDIHTHGTMVTVADAYGKMILPSGDTLSPILRVKAIQTILNTPVEGSSGIETGDQGKQLETCRWYSKGYRYPVFETVRNINIADSTTIFSTAFFYPPQEHLYLDTDPENQALLDELWKGTEEKQAIDPTAKTVMLQDIMVCKIYPNPIVSVMNIEYELKQDARVSFELYSIEGLPVKKIAAESKTAGTYYETVDCSNLSPKNYVLRIIANGIFVNEVIIKK